MPQQTSQSPLFAKYGKALDDAVQKHRSDETNYSLTRLPAGITNGVAQLTSVKFDTYKTGPNKGEYYFQARGVVVKPYEIIVDGEPMKVQGLQTMIQLAACQTVDSNKKVTSIGDNFAKILNEMRKLAGDDFTKGATGANLEALGKALEKARPFFKFSTSVRKARPGTTDADGVWENWNGYCDPPAAPTNNGQAATMDQTASNGQTEAGSSPTDAAQGGFDEFGDLVSLGAAADAGDPKAAARLTDLAREAGMSDADMESPDLPNWTSLAERLSQAGDTGVVQEEEEAAAEGEPVTEPEPEAVPPAAGQMFKFQQTDATGKPSLGKDKKPLKPVNVKIESVDEDNKTVVIVTMTKPATRYRSIPWTRLLEAV